MKIKKKVKIIPKINERHLTNPVQLAKRRWLKDEILLTASSSIYFVDDQP